jgi:hypothetical protein
MDDLLKQPLALAPVRLAECPLMTLAVWKRSAGVMIPS